MNTPYLSSVRRREDSTLVNQSQISIGESTIIKTIAFGSKQDIIGDSCAVRSAHSAPCWYGRAY